MFFFKNSNGGVYGGAAAMNTLPLPMDPAAFANGGGMFNPYAAAAMAQQQAMMMQQVGDRGRGNQRGERRDKSLGKLASSSALFYLNGRRKCASRE